MCVPPNGTLAGATFLMNVIIQGTLSTCACKGTRIHFFAHFLHQATQVELVGREINSTNN